MKKATKEQETIIQKGRAGESILVQSYAGCAKTTTLVATAKALSDDMPKLTKLAVAFNVKIKEELEQRLRNNPDWSVRTLNSLGQGTLMANQTLWNNGNLDVNDKKTANIVHEIVSHSNVRAWIEGQRFRFDVVTALIDLVNKAKMFGYKPEQITPEVIAILGDVESGPGELSVIKENIENLADKTTDAVLNGLAKLVRGALNMSIDQARSQGLIDFNDQIYLAMLYCPHHGRSWDVIFADEAQDFSRLNHMQVLKACKRQMVVLGDKYQALYGFRGATSESMEDLFQGWKEKKKTEMTRLQLSITFRCPEAIVARQTRTVGIRDFQAKPEAGLGTVFMPYVGTGEDITWDFSAIADRSELESKTASVAVLSATNAPLYVAMALLWKDLNCKEVDDFRDWCRFMFELPPKGLLNLATTQSVFTHPAYKKQANLCALHYLHLVTGLSTTEMQELFKPSDHDSKQPFLLSTIHRAKGLEWDHVYMFEPDNIGETGNMRYVAETRTRNFLGKISIEDHWRAQKAGDPLQQYIICRRGSLPTTYTRKVRRSLVASEIVKSQPSLVFKSPTLSGREKLISKVESKLETDDAFAFDPTGFLLSETNNEIHGGGSG